MLDKIKTWFLLGSDTTSSFNKAASVWWFPAILMLTLHSQLYTFFRRRIIWNVDTASPTLSALTIPTVAAGLVLVLALLFLRGNSLKWSRLDPSGRTRAFVLCGATIFTWIFITQLPSPLFPSWCMPERTLLLMSLVGLWKHPIFIYPLLFFCQILATQFHGTPNNDFS